MTTPADADPVPAPMTRPDDADDAASASPSGEPPAAPPPSAPLAPADFALAGYGPGDFQPATARIEAVTDDDAGPGWQGLRQALAVARTLHVAPSGSDSHPGTAERPLRTLARAAALVLPGTTVLVAPGRYSGGVRVKTGGTARERIVFLSTTKWGARITPPANSASKAGWDNRVNYVDIVGFDVDGSQYQGGVRWTHGIYSAGSFDGIRNNRVRHIAQHIGCNGAGGAAIGVDSFYGGAHAEVMANLVHDIGPAGCRFVQGIYVSTPARVSNNVIYRVAEGGIHMWHDAHSVSITNNTVTASNTGIIVGGGNYYRRKGGNDHTSVYSNIVFDNKMGISEQGDTGPHNRYRNNLVFQNSHYNWRLKNGLGHSATVTAAPLFVSPPGSARPNLRPGPGSPAIGRATAEQASGSDFDGRPRNAQAGFDIGAYQH